MRILKPFVLLWGVVTLLFAGLLAYAETRAFSWDEGFHVMAARLIKEGQRPYLDFCFPQTPLNAYWYAAWLRVFGDSWRGIHVIGSLLVAGAVLLTADFVLRRFPVSEWRLAGAITAAMLMGLNGAVMLFGSIGQAYGLCLLLTAVSFRLAVKAVERRGALLAAATGLFASAAATASLLTAPAIPVLLIWILYYNREGSRLRKMAAFVSAAVVPSIPVAWLFIKAPGIVFFNLVQYHVAYRTVRWEGAGQHDFEVLLGWIDSGQALLLGLLAVGGLVLIVKRSGWERARRAEFYLCAWITVLMGAEIANAHPTFSWYFLLIVPPLAILATAGLQLVSARLYVPDRPWLPVAALALLLLLGLARTLYEDAGSFTWGTMEAVAKKVDQVTPKNGTIWASEHIYFLTHRPIPEGLEFQPALKLDLPMARARELHILPHNEFERRVKAGFFQTIANCDDDRIKELGLADLYSKKEEVGDCTVFWDFTGKQAGDH